MENKAEENPEVLSPTRKIRLATLAPTSATLIAPPVRAGHERLDFIEGLRALAALWVVLSHIWIYQFGLEAHGGMLGWVSNWLLYSHLAVDVFIVLSGFCLALPVARTGGLRGGALGFWRARSRRILPPCYLALALSVGILLVLRHLDTGTWDLDTRALLVNLFLLQDIIPNGNVFDGPLWSIAVEWRLSLIFPLLAWAMRRGGPWPLLAPAAVGCGLTALVFWKAPGLTLAYPWYLLLFALGASAATAAVRPLPWAGTPWARAVLPLGLLLAGLLWAYPVNAAGGLAFGRHMPITDTVVGALTAALLVGLSHTCRSPNPSWRGLLSWPPLASVGRFSYSLYLTHMPLLHVLGHLVVLCPGISSSPLLQFVVLTGLGLPVLLGVAYLFFLVCERPFLATRKPRSQPALSAASLLH